MNDATTAVPRLCNLNNDDRLLDELIFRQDLNEISILIDFLSGRNDRSLQTLSMPDPEDPGKTMTAVEIIEAITKMRYSPEGTPTVNSRNAAILLMTKDQLNALAHPARGLSIAYTTMFIGSEAGTLFARWRDWRRDATARGLSKGTPLWGSHLRGEKTEEVFAERHDIRIDLAATTFPGLLPHARRFRHWRDGLAYFSVFWLVLTALAYWDVGLGRTLLERFDQNHKSITTAEQIDPALIGDPRCRSVAAANSAVAAKDLAGLDDKAKAACIKLGTLYDARQSTQGELDAVFRCSEQGLSTPLHVWCWRWLLAGSVQRPTPDNNSVQRPTPDNNEITWQTATSIITVFTTYVLPMMFALLGTLIGAFRAILNRIRDRELTPRDLVQMKMGMPTGLVAGIAVGLFLSPSTVPVLGEGGVAGQLTLTASGLGFLAGYASRSFFRFLDNILGTVFPEGSTRSTAAATK